MYCQTCLHTNPDDADFCQRCQGKLLVLSGVLAEEEEIDGGEDGFSIEEHLLERVSILEEVLKRTGEAVRTLLGSLQKQEENILINYAGLETVRQLLDEEGVLPASDWSDLWEEKLDRQLLAREKRDRFNGRRERIEALYSGQRLAGFRRYLQDAEYAFYAFEPDSGLRALENAFRLDPTNHELAEFLGESFFHDGDTERALGYFHRVLEERPNHYEGLVYAGVIRHQQGDFASARRHLEQAVELFPDCFLPRFSLGAVFAAQGDLSVAARHLEAALELDAVPQALYLLGRCRYEAGEIQPAIRALAEAVRLDPAFEECHHLLGMCYLQRHWNRKALDAFRHAQRLNPRRMRYEDLVAYLSGQAAALPTVGREASRSLRRAEEAMKGGDGRAAVRAYRRALRLEPDNPAIHMTFALACLHLNRSQDIRVAAQKVLDLNPGEMLKATAYATLIAALRGEGRYREGNRLGRRLLAEGESDFSKAIAYYEMAYNLAEMEGDLDRALDLARRSLEYSPEELRQFPLAALGWVHYKRHEFDKAVDFLSQSTELGASATTMTHLGMALLAAGAKEEARSVLDQAQRLDGGDLGDKMMEFMRDSARIVDQSRGGLEHSKRGAG